MRADADKTRNPAFKHPAETLLFHDFGYVLDEALVVFGAHDAGFYDVDGRADGGCDEACEEGGGEVRGEVVGERRVVEEETLEAVVGGELADGHEDGARGVGPHALPETAGAFFARHAEHAVDGVFVVPAVFAGERRVVLHAYIQDVAWVTCDAAEEA